MMDPPFILTPATPTGSYRTPALIYCADGSGGLRMVESKIYPPPSAKAVEITELRRSRCITLRRAADLLGVKPSELSGLELGRFTCSDADGDRIIQAIKEVP